MSDHLYIYGVKRNQRGWQAVARKLAFPVFAATVAVAFGMALASMG